MYTHTHPSAKASYITSYKRDHCMVKIAKEEAGLGTVYLSTYSFSQHLFIQKEYFESRTLMTVTHFFAETGVSYNHVPGWSGVSLRAKGIFSQGMLLSTPTCCLHLLVLFHHVTFLSTRFKYNESLTRRNHLGYNEKRR